MPENSSPIEPEADLTLPAEGTTTHRAAHARPLANPGRLRLHAHPERDLHVPEID